MVTFCTWTPPLSVSIWWITIPYRTAYHASLRFVINCKTHQHSPLWVVLSGRLSCSRNLWSPTLWLTSRKMAILHVLITQKYWPVFIAFPGPLHALCPKHSDRNWRKKRELLGVWLKEPVALNVLKCKIKADCIGLDIDVFSSRGCTSDSYNFLIYSVISASRLNFYV